MTLDIVAGGGKMANVEVYLCNFEVSSNGFMRKVVRGCCMECYLEFLLGVLNNVFHITLLYDVIYERVVLIVTRLKMYSCGRKRKERVRFCFVPSNATVLHPALRKEVCIRMRLFLEWTERLSSGKLVS